MRGFTYIDKKIFDQQVVYTLHTEDNQYVYFPRIEKWEIQPTQSQLSELIENLEAMLEWAKEVKGLVDNE